MHQWWTGWLPLGSQGVGHPQRHSTLLEGTCKGPAGIIPVPGAVVLVVDVVGPVPDEEVRA